MDHAHALAARPARADYGLDAPGVVRALAIAAILCLVVAAVFRPARGFVFAGVLMAAEAALMTWSSRRGKLRERERLLDLVPWRGDERVLDIGCGRGLLLLGAARRLRSGRAVGVDLWQSRDQSGNALEATLANADAEGVRDRVDVRTGDARHLEFPDASFDVVLSSLAIHNIPSAEGRERAVREAARVLRPGGRLLLLDFRHSAAYARMLRSCGLACVRRSRLHFGMFPPVRVVSARKAC
ncbi:MAG TPA: class I SAM-dependent methyltransferase [Longimicrobiales bacterium]|nr:class I SAM-dependent methyltransferase [Longimicrobiales bacterium]